MRGYRTNKFNGSGEDKTVPTFLNNVSRFTVVSVDWIQIGMAASKETFIQGDSCVIDICYIFKFHLAVSNTYLSMSLLINYL